MSSSCCKRCVAGAKDTGPKTGPGGPTARRQQPGAQREQWASSPARRAADKTGAARVGARDSRVRAPAAAPRPAGACGAGGSKWGRHARAGRPAAGARAAGSRRRKCKTGRRARRRTAPLGAAATERMAPAALGRSSPCEARGGQREGRVWWGSGLPRGGEGAVQEMNGGRAAVAGAPAARFERGAARARARAGRARRGIGGSAAAGRAVGAPPRLRIDGGACASATSGGALPPAPWK